MVCSAGAVPSASQDAVAHHGALHLEPGVVIGADGDARAGDAGGRRTVRVQPARIAGGIERDRAHAIHELGVEQLPEQQRAVGVRGGAQGVRIGQERRAIGQRLGRHAPTGSGSNTGSRSRPMRRRLCSPLNRRQARITSRIASL